MSETPFFKTRMGQRFYDRTVPELVKQLARVNDTLDRLITLWERQDDASESLSETDRELNRLSRSVRGGIFVATGRSNKLVGQVGEFLVCAELGRRGLIASPFAGNVPGYDVIATDERCVSVPIQVKTSNGGSTWQFNAATFLDIHFDPKTKRQTIRKRKRLTDPGMVWIFVWLGHRSERPDRFFVTTHRKFQGVIYRHHSAYLKRHGGRRPKQPESTHIAISLDELDRFEDAWEVVEEELEKRQRK